MTSASQAYHERVNIINSQINLLCVLIREHGASLDSPNWGNVGDMRRVSEMLRQAIEAVPAPIVRNDKLIDRAYEEVEAEARLNRAMTRGC